MDRKPFKKLRRDYNLFRAYKVDSPYYNSPNIKLHNWVGNPTPHDYWIPRFIEHKKLAEGKSVGIFSVFGLRSMMRIDRSNVKIFVARENVHRSNWKVYDDMCLNERCLDLCVGFDYHQDDERYVRFPLWIMWLFPPEIDYEGIKAFCERVNSMGNSSYSDRKFCSFISSHDDIGRKELFNEIDAIGKIDSAGKFMHNCDDLQRIFNDDKLAFLRHYRFNLCPENSNCEGYCTEKIFEAINSGCVPIYWGSDNNPEPDILNQNAICFVKVGEQNSVSALDRIKQLNENGLAYNDFAKQPRLLQNAPEVIMQYVESFEKKLKEIIRNS